MVWLDSLADFFKDSLADSFARCEYKRGREQRLQRLDGASFLYHLLDTVGLRLYIRYSLRLQRLRSVVRHIRLHRLHGRFLRWLLGF